jgi:hypothetical protein
VLDSSSQFFFLSALLVLTSSSQFIFFFSALLVLACSSQFISFFSALLVLACSSQFLQPDDSRSFFLSHKVSVLISTT